MSIVAVRQDITIEAGADFEFSKVIRDSNDAIVDLTGATVEAQLREFQEAQDYLQFIATHNDADGEITISLLHEDTAAIGYSYGYYDVYVTFPNNSRSKVLYGEVNISPAVTRTEEGTILYLLSFADEESFPETGSAHRIYFSSATNKLYRWTGAQYAETYYNQQEIDALFTNVAQTLSDHEDAIEELDQSKADASSVYTKDETDTLLDEKANVGDSYTKSEDDALLAQKANADDVYTKTETDELLAVKADTGDSYTKDEDDDLLAQKADADDVYTKDETDTLLDGKANIGASYTKSEADTLLSAKADKTDVDEEIDDIDSAIAGIGTALTSKADASDLTALANRVSADEQTIASKADASSVYTKTEADALLSSKANTADVTSALAQKADADDLADAVADIADLDLAKAPAITETASGAMVTIPDGADGMPVKALTVGIEPVQDLHGYDSPWPAGGGKNLFKGKDLSQTTSGVTFTCNVDGKITASGTNSSSNTIYFVIYDNSNGNRLQFKAGTYTFSSENTLSTGLQISFIIRDSTGATIPDLPGFALTSSLRTKTIVANQDFELALNVNLSGESSVSYNAGIQIESGSTATTWSPYENICPITGHTQAVVTRTGKNLVESIVNRLMGLTNNNTQLMLLSGDGTCLKFHCKSGVTYTVSGCPDINRNMAGIFDSEPNIFDVGTRETIISSTATSFTFTASKTGVCLAYVANSIIDTSTAIIELGSSATSYEPYQGQQISVTFPTEAGTVYGATLDLTNRMLTVDRAMADLGTLTWRKNNSGYYYAYNLSSVILAPSSNSRVADILCESYKPDTAVNASSINGSVAVNNTGTVILCNSSIETLEDLVTALTNVKLVYTLATPLTYQLTESEISDILSTLYGENHIWSDTGDVSVEYRADTKAYIQAQIAESETLTRKMIADIANGDLAPKTLAVGDLVIVGDELRKATESIGQGSAITSLNSTTANLADVIKALQ